MLKPEQDNLFDQTKLHTSIIDNRFNNIELPAQVQEAHLNNLNVLIHARILYAPTATYLQPSR